MREYSLRVVEAMVANGSSMGSIDDFIDGTSLSEDDRSALWLFAWSETSREKRTQRVAELIGGDRQLADVFGTDGPSR